MRFRRAGTPRAPKRTGRSGCSGCGCDASGVAAAGEAGVEAALVGVLRRAGDAVLAMAYVSEATVTVTTMAVVTVFRDVTRVAVVAVV